MKKVRTIIFPVGGYGTRFLPATKAIPKEMLPVAEKPLIQYAFEEAREAGIEKFIFVTGRNKNAIEDHFDNSFELQAILSDRKKKETLEKTIGWLPEAGQIVFLRQQNPLGLGHAILCAEKFIDNEPFVVSLADEMCYDSENNFLKQMIDVVGDQNINLLGLNEVEKENVSKYGIVEPVFSNGDLIKINGMVEKPNIEDAQSNLSIVGKYILQSEIFNYLKNTSAGSGGEIQLTDAMNEMLKSTGNFYGLKFKKEEFDCGSVLGYLEANIYYALKNEKIKNDVKNIINKFYELVNE